MRRRGAIAAVALLVPALLAGCVAIPTSGPLSQHELRGVEDQPVNFLAPGPEKGDSQEEILDGFIRAGIDTRDRYATARSFLTGDLAGKWNPSASVLVTDGSQNRIERVGATSATLGVRAAAKVDAIGVYSGTAEPAETVFSFSFRRVRGQWRISAAPDGTVLSPYNFSLVFGPYPLYFVDPTRAFLVPDLRWFPRGETAPDRIVRALLSGPAPWLGSGVVLSAFSKDTQLGSDGVSISGGTATVDLSSEVLEQDAATRRRMTAQLRASLDEVGPITSVQVTARGFPVEVPPAGDAASPVFAPQVGSVPLAATATTLGTVSASGIRPFDPFSARVLPLGPRAAVLDRSRTAMAVLTASGVWRVDETGDPVLVDGRSAQIAPSIDPEGLVWTAQSSGLTSLQATDERGQVHDVATSSPSSGALLAFRISRDGARIAAVVAAPTGPVVMVGAIQRDATLAPTGIGPMLEIPVDGESVVDLAWSDPVTLALLVRKDGEVLVRSQQVGGRSSDLGRAADATQIIGGNGGADGLRVLTADGRLLQQTGAGGWQATGVGGLRLLVIEQ